jgi:hypothetical protein
MLVGVEKPPHSKVEPYGVGGKVYPRAFPNYSGIQIGQAFSPTADA